MIAGYDTLIAIAAINAIMLTIVIVLKKKLKEKQNKKGETK